MLFRDSAGVELLDIDISISNIPTFQDARMIYVRGSGRLSASTEIGADTKYGHRYITQMMLNHVPLLKINAPSCPTCRGLLATGYGIDKADCAELRSVSEKLNREYVSLEDSIDSLKPLLGLLESGLYIIADAMCFPTNGDGTFFWNTPNGPAESPATAGILVADADYAYVSGQPVFLYPTQDTDCFCEERVRYYAEKFRSTEKPPRAIAYNFGEFISFVIDGHHKACAAAVLGIPLCCIVIVPFCGYGYHKAGKEMVPDTLYFSSLSVNRSDIPGKYLPPLPGQSKNPELKEDSKGITAGTINHRIWERAYLESAKKYPSTEEYADMVASGINDLSEIDSLIAECFADPNQENQQKMKAVLLILAMHNDPRLKETAIACTRQLPDCKLKVQAYKVLCGIKNDAEIEQLFIDYLIDHDDKHDMVRSIIDLYWE